MDPNIYKEYDGFQYGFGMHLGSTVRDDGWGFHFQPKLWTEDAINSWDHIPLWVGQKDHGVVEARSSTNCNYSDPRPCS